MSYVIILVPLWSLLCKWHQIGKYVQSWNWFKYWVPGLLVSGQNINHVQIKIRKKLVFPKFTSVLFECLIIVWTQFLAWIIVKYKQNKQSNFDQIINIKNMTNWILAALFEVNKIWKMQTFLASVALMLRWSSNKFKTVSKVNIGKYKTKQNI